MSSGIIYAATCQANHKVYIGQAYREPLCSGDWLLRRRRSKHHCDAKRGNNCPFHCALRKYGTSAFAWVILHEVNDKAELDRLETLEIIQHNSTSRARGYNATTGGDSPTITAASRAKQRASAIRRWSDPEKKRIAMASIAAGRAAMPEESREAMRELGRRLQSPEIKERRVAGIRKTAQSEEFRAKRSERSKLMWERMSPDELAKRVQTMADNRAKGAEKRRRVMQTTEYKKNLTRAIRARLAREFVAISKDGTIVARYFHIVDAANALGVKAPNISACLHGRAKTSRGLRFRFVEG